MGYGVSGNYAVPTYSSVDMVNTSPLYYEFGNPEEVSFGYRPVYAGNPFLGWEKTASLNLGIDFGVFKNRLSGNIDVYSSRTTDLLQRRALPPHAAIPFIYDNIGETRTRGFEVLLHAVNVSSSAQGGFRWTTDLSLTFADEEIVELASGVEHDIANGWHVGYSPDVWYDYEFDGIWQYADSTELDLYSGFNYGQIKLVDQNNDTTISEDDRTILGKRRPSWYGSFNNRFEYMGFDLGIMIVACMGFLIDLFDPSVDERFHGTFNDVFFANNPNPDQYPVWDTTEVLGDGTEIVMPPEMVGQPILAIGDTAFRMFKEAVDPDQYYVRGTSTPWYLHKTRHYYMLDMSKMYARDGTIQATETNERRTYFDMQKWYDYIRPHNGENQDVIGSQRGQRDFIVLRLPELYYNIIEASLGSGASQQAYDYLVMLADKRSIDGNGASMLQAYGVSGPGDIDIDFILDDKAREFAGEQQRWFDLKRTGKTLERIRENNPDASPNIEEKHLVRPIPQLELDAIENGEDYESGWGIY